MWRLQLIRAGVFLACLGVIAARVFLPGLVRSHSNEGIAGHPATGVWAAGCPAHGVPAVALVPQRYLVSLHTDVTAVMQERQRRLYEVGGVTSDNAWSDNDPDRSAISRDTHAREPAGYEMRWWAPNGDDVVADAFMFRTEAQARAFFESAASPRCRPDGEAVSAASPPLARDLVWLNPERVLQIDVFLLRGDRVYRIADVPPQPHGVPSKATRAATLEIVDRLACSLPESGCQHTRLWMPSGSRRALSA